MKKLVLICISMFFILFLFSNNVSAENNKWMIDGNFEDWSNTTEVDITNQSKWFKKVSAVYDDFYIYVHVKEKDSQPWAGNYPTIKFNCDGISKDIVIAKVDYSQSDGIFDLSIKNSWWKDINNANGKVLRKNGFNEWEFKIPIEEIFLTNANETANNLIEHNIKKLVISWNLGGDVSFDGEDYSNEKKPTATPIVAPVPNPDSSSISIDGYYDDWERIQKTEVYYNEMIKNYAALIKDENYLYFYIEMSPKYGGKIPLDAIDLMINHEKNCLLFIRYPDSNGTTDWKRDVDLLSEGIIYGLQTFTYYPNTAMGDVSISVLKNGQGDRLEARIQISELEKILGLEAGTINTGASVTLKLSNVGRQSLEIVGVSTGTYVGVAITIVAIITIWLIQRNRKKSKK